LRSLSFGEHWHECALVVMPITLICARGGLRRHVPVGVASRRLPERVLDDELPRYAEALERLGG
jgi:hypothetical protein